MVAFFTSLSHRQRLAAMVYSLMVLGLMMLAAQPSHPRGPHTFADSATLPTQTPLVAAN